MDVRPKLFYPSLVVAAISVTLFSLIGIAGMTGTLPFAHSREKDMAAEKAPADAALPADAAKAVCASCGTVESIGTVERKGGTTGLGAVAGGLTGLVLGNQFGRGNGRTMMTIAGGAGGAYLGNKIEQNAHRSTAYRIRVRMDDGTLRTFYQNEAPALAVGGQVKIIGNAVVPQS
jgi:outer membrane lipoprotein SlyB